MTTTFHMSTYFPDWIVPLRFTATSGAKVRSARLEELTSLDPLWRVSPGDPQRYAALGADFLVLYKQPSSTGTILTINYARAPVTLANDADTPEIPPEYHQSLVNYAIYRMREVEGGQEFAKTLPLLNLFFDAATKFASFVRARNRGQQYDKWPFELESFDRSQLLKLRPDLEPNRKEENAA